MISNMFCTSACVAPQTIEEVDVNDKVIKQMEEMRKALEDVKGQLAEERRQRKEMQVVQSNMLRADTSSLLRGNTQALSLGDVVSTTASKSYEPSLGTIVQSTITVDDRRIAAKYKDRMIDGIVVTYLKERTETRMTAVCCLDVDCNYLVLLSGKVEFSTREILCQTQNILGVFTLNAEYKEIFPPAVVAMLENDGEVDRTLMITYTDSNEKKIRFCMVMESAEARHSFKTTLDVIVDSKKFGGVDDEDDQPLSEAGSEGIL